MRDHICTRILVVFSDVLLPFPTQMAWSHFLLLAAAHSVSSVVFRYALEINCTTRTLANREKQSLVVIRHRMLHVAQNTEAVIQLKVSTMNFQA